MSNLNLEQRDALYDLAASRLDEVISALDVRLWGTPGRFVGPCPVHGGDNPHALTLYRDGHTTAGNWNCYTSACEAHFGKGLFGFIRGVLSHDRRGWANPGDRECTWPEAYDWAVKTLSVDISQLKTNPGQKEARSWLRRANCVWGGNLAGEPEGWPRAEVISRLEIPSPYFLSRSFSREVLRKYDVGESVAARNDPNHQFHNRAVVPIHSLDGSRIVSFTARSIHPACPQCSLFHALGPCPQSPQAKEKASKWRHHKNFSRSDYLYNWHFALPTIRKSLSVVLVEGPCDVWRCVEGGVYNAVALFGTTLTDGQQALLETSGAMEVVCLLDQDRAGQAAIKLLKDQLFRGYKLSFPVYSQKDIGEMTPAKVRELLIA